DPGYYDISETSTRVVTCFNVLDHTMCSLCEYIFSDAIERSLCTNIQTGCL
ncbi:hypothetical protein A2U01_0017399, partial [Trifolium medium]|nr:hypothetical protein [Trifolium medium]